MSAIVDFLTKTRDTFQAALDDSRFHATLGEIADLVTASLRGDGKLLTIGNGGSAADAQHIAGEFVSRLNYDRPPAAAVALTTDTSVITAIGNDYGYEHVFERQVLALGRPGDVLLALSTSGRSPSVLKAMDAARGRGLRVVAFTGATGGAMPERADVCLHAPSDATPLIQQIHITAAHIVCGLVEENLFPRGTAA
ncbi:D-sedoheptulose 7-phosphate isomerase [Methylobacterium sp. OT2]|uniref:D-sedoheptulose 7-phosphate isomerase n=1 Tax=Methylobacterium sp. OT2 TaxID=2813779 RepID=UPI00197BC968|nr:D-sedoheptulose 7-phosphate isomerase [Methylobacterium sp. OT2]MBN4094714.1 D-sedoheptulose 7-phosphate isomerase [Methylobacterium sp. OT2]